MRNGYTPLEQCLTTVFAPDEGSEAVLHLEMSSDAEITGYEKPLSSPEWVDLPSLEGDEEQAAIGSDHFLYRTLP